MAPRSLTPLLILTAPSPSGPHRSIRPLDGARPKSESSRDVGVPARAPRCPLPPGVASGLRQIGAIRPVMVRPCGFSPLRRVAPPRLCGLVASHCRSWGSPRFHTGRAGRFHLARPVLSRGAVQTLRRPSRRQPHPVTRAVAFLTLTHHLGSSPLEEPLPAGRRPSGRRRLRSRRAGPPLSGGAEAPSPCRGTRPRGRTLWRDAQASPQDRQQTPPASSLEGLDRSTEVAPPAPVRRNGSRHLRTR